MSDLPNTDWKTIRERTGPYPAAAYQFVRLGLQHTVKTVHGEDALDATPEDESRHVTGQDLCIGLRSFAVEQYGSLARLVLTRWGIRRTRDFGKIVFALVEGGLMRTTEDDSIEDFEEVFDFDEAFGPVAQTS